MIRGSIDFVDHDKIRGWVQDEQNPDAALSVVISCESGVLGTVVADRFRADLKEAGISLGCHAFEFSFTSRLSKSESHSITLRIQDGAELPGSPVLLELLAPTALAIGNIDHADRRGIKGWGQNNDRSKEPVHLIVTNNGELISRILANRYRTDLEAAGIGEGRHGFAIEFDEPLSIFKKHVIRVRRELDGFDIPGSPIVIEAAKRLDLASELEIRGILDRYSKDEDVERKIQFLAAELHKLVQQRSDLESRRFDRRRDRDLARRWGAPIANKASQGASKPRALVIDDRLPVLDRDAGSNVIVSHMKSLQRLGYEVSLIPASQFAAAPEAIANLRSEHIHVCALPFYGSAEEVLWRQAGEFDLIYLHRITNAGKYGELVRQHFPKARKIFSVADLHHVRILRQAGVENRPELEPLARRLKFQELLAAASADAVITHSSYEAKLLRSNLPKANIHRVLWAVAPKPTRVPLNARSGVAFIGGYDHAPNLDAAKWLMSDLVPYIQKQDRTIECYLVGSGFPDELKRMKIQGLTILGHVTDLTEVFDRIRLTVAPLAYGAGVKGKIIESLAAGIPCVHTSLAAEGMDLPDRLSECRADDAQSIAKAIWELHNSTHRYQACVEAGLAYVRKELTVEKLDQAMAQAAKSRA